MAKSKITLTFTNWDSGDPTGTTIDFTANGLQKNEVAVLVRSTTGQFNVAGDNASAAASYKAAWQADYAFGFATINVAGNVVTIEALFDGVVFADFDTDPAGRVSELIENVAYDPPMSITGSAISEADASPCTNVKITLTTSDGTPPYEWVSPLPGNVGLSGDVPRGTGPITVTLEDDNAEQDSIVVNIPEVFDNTAIDEIVIEGDPSGLYGSVSVIMNTFPSGLITYEYSLDNITFQTGNVFTSVLPGTYTIYVRDNFGCTISQEFEVTLSGIRPPVYRLIPKSNSFGWLELQAAVNDCTNPYNGTNAKPNDYKPLRWYNPKYFQPWCPSDSPTTQFRSNYDTLTARLINILTDVEEKTMTIVKQSDNIGRRQILDAKLYDRGSGQTGIYFTTGNIYDTDGTTVIDTHSLNGLLPEWAKVGQKFFLSDSAADGLFEIQQIIYDSTLLVNAIVINRVYTDVSEPITVRVDATYNKLNYETYEFITDFSDVPEGCYKIELAMVDSLAEYPNSTWESLPFKVSSSHRDLVYMESSTHIDDGILYSTGIVHKQRFQGLFYEEDFPSNYEVVRDSRKEINKLDGRVQHVLVLEAIDVPYWVHEKLALFISKKTIRVNNLAVQFDEPFEREKNAQYSRVNLRAEAFVSGYEQYITNAYDIL